MAIPNRNPADSPGVETASPALAYVTKPNIALPIEAQRQGVVQAATVRETDLSPQQSGSSSHVAGRSHVAPPSE
jgi:hypothetical protein